MSSSILIAPKEEIAASPYPCSFIKNIPSSEKNAFNPPKDTSISIEVSLARYEVDWTNNVPFTGTTSISPGNSGAIAISLSPRDMYLFMKKLSPPKKLLLSAFQIPPVEVSTSIGPRMYTIAPGSTVSSSPAFN